MTILCYRKAGSREGDRSLREKGGGLRMQPGTVWKILAVGGGDASTPESRVPNALGTPGLPLRLALPSWRHSPHT